MRISIGSKILALLGVSASVGFIIAATSHHVSTAISTSTRWVSHTYEVINEFEQIGSDLKDAETAQRGFVITGEDRFLEPYYSGRKALAGRFSKLESLTIDNEQQKARIATLKNLSAVRLERMASNIATRREAGFEAVRKIILDDKGRTVMNEIRRELDQAAKNENELLASRLKSNEKLIQTAREISIAGALLIILVFGTTVFFVRRNILSPLAKVMSTASEISKGDLTQAYLEISSSDEIGELATIFNSMLKFLKQVSRENREVSDHLASAATEILAAIQQQATAVKEQAASIQQTTVTMEEIGQSGMQVNERGRQVSNSAEATLHAAQLGITAVQNTNVTMVNIRSQIESVAQNIVNLSDRNQTIGELITSVNDITEQSNLLALNAAIEAADAGEFGRRFSVVANEMKNLSDQCKDATLQVRLILSQIQKGINTSVMLTEEAVKRAEGGKTQADLAERTILQLTDSTGESIKTFQQIVGATGQQQIGFEQIMQALKSIKLGAEQTALSTNQLEKAALSLNSLGQQLQVSNARYRI